MDERLRVLELIRDKKINPQEGLDLLEAMEHDPWPEQNCGDRPRSLKITSQSGGATPKIIHIPLGMIRFLDGMFPGLVRLNIGKVSSAQLMERVHQGHPGEIYRDCSRGKVTTIELV